MAWEGIVIWLKTSPAFGDSRNKTWAQYGALLPSGGRTEQFLSLAHCQSKNEILPYGNVYIQSTVIFKQNKTKFTKIIPWDNEILSTSGFTMISCLLRQLPYPTHGNKLKGDYKHKLKKSMCLL